MGLVDELGGLDRAIVLAAELAEVGEYDIKRLRPALSARDLLLSSLSDIRSEVFTPDTMTLAGRMWQEVIRAQSLLQALNDPGDSYAICEVCLASGSLTR
jgi:protease-4